jgi:hypothetical protein
MAFVKTGGRQFYCPDCAPTAVKAVDRVQGMKYYYQNRDTIIAKNRKKRKEENTNENQNQS